MRQRVLAAVVGFAVCVACQRAARSADQIRAAAGAASSTGACDPVATFADGRTPARIVHVSTKGDDATGSGSVDQPFRSVTRAAKDIAPGTAIHLHAGIYEGRTFLIGVRGTEAAPIWIMGAPGEARPGIRGGPEGLHLVQPRYVIVQSLEIFDTADNGINVDDGDDVTNPDAARFVVFRDLDVHDTGQRPSGVANCLKLAGVNDVAVLRSRFARCGNGPGSGATGVDGVGVHRAVVRASRFEENGFGGLQFKGGSADIEISGNALLNSGWRGVNMGGSTAVGSFRPPPMPSNLVGANYEAARIRVTGNLFTGGEAAAAFVGCVDCEFTRNTVIDPSKWVLRILQETVTNERLTFAPASRGVIADNIFYFRRADLNAGEDINVGAGTDSKSFSLERNVWYAHDHPGESGSRLPAFAGPQRGSIVGADPGVVNPGAPCPPSASAR